MGKDIEKICGQKLEKDWSPLSVVRGGLDPRDGEKGSGQASEGL